MKVRPTVVILLLLLFAGCVTVPTTPTGKYYDALATFNDVVESYLWHFEAVDAEKQTLLKKYVNPVIREASTALDYWGQARGDATRMQVYDTIFRRLQQMMIKYGAGGDV